MKNAYNIICEFLDRLMTEDNHLSFLVYRMNDEYRLKLVYPVDERSNRSYIQDDVLYFGDHFEAAKEEYHDYVNYDSFYFKKDDLLKIKKIMFIIIEKYIFWENGGESPYKEEQIELDNEYYLEDLEDPSTTMQIKNIKWVEEQIPEFSWSDFQNSKKLKQFIK